MTLKMKPCVNPFISYPFHSPGLVCLVNPFTPYTFYGPCLVCLPNNPNFLQSMFTVLLTTHSLLTLFTVYVYCALLTTHSLLTLFTVHVYCALLTTHPFLQSMFSVPC